MEVTVLLWGGERIVLVQDLAGGDGHARGGRAVRHRPCLRFLESYLLVGVGCRSQLNGACHVARRYTVAFIMPTKYTKATLPKPENPNVQVRGVVDQPTEPPCVTPLSFKRRSLTNAMDHCTSLWATT